MRSSNGTAPVAAWSDPRHRRGLWGERVAMEFLVRRGWAIEAHRFRWGHHDLDLIARHGALVAFIEVKTRGSADYGAPVESVGWRKRRTIARLADIWRLRHGRPDDLYRFDVIGVRVLSGRAPVVEHTQDAWRGGPP